jgi:anaerobic dimethyl sulfoxide reductase subunit B (iron-sulfur subunit)
VQFGFYFDQTRCTGCATCVLACRSWHAIPGDPANWARVQATEAGLYPAVSLSFLFSTCWHCAQPACAAACPVEAVHKRAEDGITIVDRTRCLGGDACSHACLKACPYKAPQFSSESSAKMQKCDLCLDRWSEGKRPICVESCPVRALDAGPEGELAARYSAGRKALGFTFASKLGPSVFFRAKALPAMAPVTAGGGRRG